MHGDALDDGPRQSRRLNPLPPLSDLFRGPNVSDGHVVERGHDPRRPGLVYSQVADL